MKKDILFIVEDDLMQQKMLRHHFEDELGYSVQIFTNPDDVISHISEKPFAIVLDHFFLEQKETGLNYLKIIKTKSPRTPVIYHTICKEPEVRKLAMAAGAADYIIKDEASLVRLRTVLDHLQENKRGVGRWNRFKKYIQRC